MPSGIGKDRQEQRYWTCVELIKDLQDINKQARASLTYLVLTGVLIFIAVFNAYLGWFKNYNYVERSDYALSKNLSPYSELIQVQKQKINDALRPFPIYDKRKEFNNFITYIHQAGAYASFDINTVIVEPRDGSVPFSINYDTISKNPELLMAELAKYGILKNKDSIKKFCGTKKIVRVNLQSEIVTRSMLENHLSYFRFQIPLLGIQTNVSDIGIIGGLLSMILYVWYYFIVIRENSIVSDILKIVVDIYEDDKFDGHLKFERMRFIVKRAIHSFVFNTSSDAHFYKDNRVRYLIPHLMAESLSFGNLVFFFLSLIPSVSLVGVLIADYHSISIFKLYEIAPHGTNWRMAISAVLLSINLIFWGFVIYVVSRTNAVQKLMFTYYDKAKLEQRPS